MRLAEPLAPPDRSACTRWRSSCGTAGRSQMSARGKSGHETRAGRPCARLDRLKKTAPSLSQARRSAFPTKSLRRFHLPQGERHARAWTDQPGQSDRFRVRERGEFGPSHARYHVAKAPFRTGAALPLGRRHRLIEDQWSRIVLCPSGFQREPSGNCPKPPERRASCRLPPKFAIVAR
jgi:hypothetical protein